MRVEQIEFKMSAGQIFRLYCIGDEHGGTVHHHQKLFQQTIDLIKDDKQGYWIGQGDKCEFISPSDKRWDSGGIADWVNPDNLGVSQSEWYMDMVMPIKDKCIGLIEGNHEIAIKKGCHIDVQKNICKGLSVRDLSYSCFLKYVFKLGTGAYIYTHYATHGAGCAITPGAKLTRLQRVMDSFNADIISHGHVHSKITHEVPYLELDRKNHLVNRIKVGAMTGCFFRTYTENQPSSYAEQKNYPPSTLGGVVFTINPMTKEIRVEKI